MTNSPGLPVILGNTARAWEEGREGMGDESTRVYRCWSQEGHVSGTSKLTGVTWHVTWEAQLMACHPRCRHWSKTWRAPSITPVGEEWHALYRYNMECCWAGSQIVLGRSCPTADTRQRCLDQSVTEARHRLSRDLPAGHAHALVRMSAEFCRDAKVKAKLRIVAEH